MSRFDGLEGCVALVTGAASGIGAATALALAQQGARVAAVDLQEPDPAGRDVLLAAAPKASFHSLDVREEAAVQSVVEELVTDAGRLDVVVNAAGVAGGGPVHLLDAGEWDRVLDINLKGTFLVCKHALVPMLAQNSGRIVNVASVEGLEATDGSSCYAASKAGVVLLTRNLAVDYARRGIRANCVCPGLIETPMTQGLFDGALAEAGARFVAQHQIARRGRPEEVAAAILFLVSEASSFVTGHALVVDGGFTAGHRMGVIEAFGL